MPLLFSYGTLQFPSVQRAHFGRLLEGAPDQLPGFRLEMLAIRDPAVIATSGTDTHPILRPSGSSSDAVPGTVFELSAEELRAADSYEVSDYRRIEVRLQSGVDAWVYIDAAHPVVTGSPVSDDPDPSGP
ncbi:gamma-glutamylcyclotransferase family protein [Arthrobacter sp. Soc17.1.1.1]|uniref:gamma-glutamylcyclotransferase family protein n=1 Tax=Arthrobacter sp. Soc17.1.1.1 TaxID=3121277 RepID=UPI002FE42F5E